MCIVLALIIADNPHPPTALALSARVLAPKVNETR